MASPSRLWDVKSVEAAVAQGEGSGLRRALGAFDLTSIGIAAIIGTGIFVLLGQVALDNTGPAVILSIAIGGIVVVFTALAFAEFASMVPASGSVYLYAYGSMGRLPAFVIGWTTLNAYAVGNMVVSGGFSDYFQSGLRRLSAGLPGSFTASPPDGGVLDLPAFLVMLGVTALCLPRIRKSTFVNNVLVVLKLSVVLLVLALGVFLIDPDNWQPFSPFGTRGVLSGAAILLFAYFGFDTVAAAGSESRNPKRDLPIGIVVSVLVCAVLYMGMGAVVTGMQPSTELNRDAPVAEAFRAQEYGWAADIITIGVLIAMVTVLYAFHLAVTRVLQAMAIDGFLPARLGSVNSATGTPWTVTIVVGVLTAVGAALLPFEAVVLLSVVSTVAMYIIICLGVIVLKIRRPDLPRRFRAPMAVPVLAIIGLVILMVGGTRPAEHFAFLAWIGLGLMVYGFFAHRSSVRADARHPGIAPGPAKPMEFTRAKPPASVSYGRTR